ncbi:MAG: prepilin-type N-terminal cleavage/methylation domain-containing protein [Trichormus sp. ATA11-4-KO1]|jgi:prepilin-type N-terminal cleavage/methylation domain-containing protein|nr:prepilin-type N-terminal cleavage/methylation domain-containing protein [Trichormus sp. ATA11-4-KO1]
MYSLVLNKTLQKIPVKILSTKPESSAQLAEKNAGFTLLEILVVVVIIAVLAAISAPGWLGFVNRQRVNKANDIILAALQEAQREAKRTKVNYSVSFKTEDDIPQIAVYQGTTPSNWRNLGADLEIKPREVLLRTNIAETNKAGSSISDSSNVEQIITFDYMGTLPNADFGTVPDGSTEAPGLKIILALPQSNDPTSLSDVKRCVIVKTLLGAIITEKDDKCN